MDKHAYCDIGMRGRGDRGEEGERWRKSHSSMMIVLLPLTTQLFNLFIVTLYIGNDKYNSCVQTHVASYFNE